MTEDHEHFDYVDRREFDSTDYEVRRLRELVEELRRRIQDLEGRMPEKADDGGASHDPARL